MPFEVSAATLPGVYSVVGLTGITFLDGNRVDGADSRQPRLEWQLETSGQHGRLGHTRSLAPACLPRIQAVEPAVLPLERLDDELLERPPQQQILDRPMR